METIITGYCLIRNNQVIVDDQLEHFQENFITFADFIKSLYKKESINYPKFFKMDALSKLGFMTSELLLKQKGPETFHRDRTGVVISNSASSLDTDLIYHETIRDRNNYFPSPSVFVYTLPNIMTGEICIRNKFKGENAFLITERLDSRLLYLTVSEMIAQERVDHCITGRVELLKDGYEALLLLAESAATAAIAGRGRNFGIFSPAVIEHLYLKI
jgi:hypothetical protein